MYLPRYNRKYKGTTENTKAQQKLEQANKRMKMAEDIASLSHWHYFVNKKEFKMPGIIPALLGKEDRETRCNLNEYLQYVHPEDRNKLTFFMPDKINSNDYQEHRLYLNGEMRYLHTRIIGSHETEEGEIIEGYIQDMTSIVERVHELEMVKYAVNNAGEEIFSCSIDGTVVFANNKFMTHHNIKGVISENDYKIYDLENSVFTMNEWARIVTNVKKENGSYKFNVTSKAENEENQSFEVITYIIKNEQGEDLIWSFARNITIRIHQENKIKELNRIMDAILNNIPVYLFVKDTGNEFRYIYWNKAFANHAKIPASKVIGKTDYEVFPSKADADHFRKDDLALLKKGSNIEFEEEFLDACGETRTVHTLKSIIQSDNGAPWVMGVSWDITDIKKVEKELIDAKEKAVQSDKLKSAFLANMSHEIRTPLNAIVGFSKLLSETTDQEEKEQYSAIIDSNAELLLQLINDILDLSKIEAGTLEFVDKDAHLSDICRDSYEILHSRVNPGVEMIYEPSPDIVLRCDGNRLTQVLINLLTNAIKFTTIGTIRFGYQLKDQQTLEFFVKDTGSGIPTNKINSIFSRFIKLNNFVQGTGLGLSICKTIIEKMGGDIWVKSEDKIGSEFYFTIPYRPVVLKVEKTSNDEVSNLLSNKSDELKTILVAEDIDSNFLLVQAAIGKLFHIVRAINGLDAVDKFKNMDIDLIIMDIEMPVMNGHEATRMIRELSQTVPIIALTSFAFESDRQDALKSGCNDFVTKPISINHFMDIITKYIN